MFEDLIPDKPEKPEKREYKSSCYNCAFIITSWFSIYCQKKKSYVESPQLICKDYKNV
jgi:hypothetical protein